MSDASIITHHTVAVYFFWALFMMVILFSAVVVSAVFDLMKAIIQNCKQADQKEKIHELETRL